MRPWYAASIIAALFLFIINIIATPILHVYRENYQLPVHKTLYVDRNMTEEEMAVIVSSAWEWHATTKGMVIYDVIKLPSKNIDVQNGIVICLVSPDFPEVIDLDTQRPDANHLAYYKRAPMPYIGVIPDRIPIKDYRTVIIHELGHSLGLKHNEGIAGIGTLMYPDMDFEANYITDTDLENFCKLYNCDANQLHDEQEPSHI